ncbi:MAG: flippase-like domain-containing protein [Chloroflexota bacterium]|nr:flippase-like domain-containing protein [Chloroflexota bacterium]
MTEKTLERHLTIDRRQLIYLVILGAGVFLLVPKLIGFRHVLQLLEIANPIFLVLALGAETLRYFMSAGSTLALARIFDVDVPLVPMTEAFFGGAAANRTLSTGGAPGMLIRLIFLEHEHLSAGQVAAIYLIEDLVGFVIGGLVFLAGLIAVSNTLPRGNFVVDVALVFAVASPLMLAAGWYLYHRRAWVERFVQAIARVLDRPVEWLLGREVLAPKSVQHGLDDFYVGMHAARRQPRFVIAAFLLNLVRYIAGAAALYFAFRSMDESISLGALILILTSTSVLSTVSAVPGEVAILGSSFAFLSLAFGVPGDLALMALLLSRANAFWMPIPVGFAAIWHLRRKHLL